MNQAKLFGKRVRAIRKAARITQEAAAETAHLNPKYLGEIERGKKRPSFEAMTSLAKALKVSPEAFFQFDRDETDERTVRRKIEGLLTFIGSQGTGSRFVLWFGGLHGKKKLGMEQVARTAEDGYYLQPFAKLFLHLLRAVKIRMPLPKNCCAN